MTIGTSNDSDLIMSVFLSKCPSKTRTHLRTIIDPLYKYIYTQTHTELYTNSNSLELNFFLNTCFPESYDSMLCKTWEKLLDSLILKHNK